MQTKSNSNFYAKENSTALHCLSSRVLILTLVGVASWRSLLFSYALQCL